MFRDGRFERGIAPGAHGLFAPFCALSVQVYDLTGPEFEHPRFDFLVEEACGAVARGIDSVQFRLSWKPAMTPGARGGETFTLSKDLSKRGCSPVSASLRSRGCIPSSRASGGFGTPALGQPGVFRGLGLVPVQP